MITKLAVKYLTWKLRRDEDFWRSYQANIAMAIYDEIDRCFLGGNAEKAALHRMCNSGAENFMKLWTKK